MGSKLATWTILTLAIGAAACEPHYQVSANRRLVLFVRSDSSVWACGIDAENFGLPDNGYAVQLRPSGSTTYVSSGHGDGYLGIEGFGDNSYGQLGPPVSPDNHFNPPSHHPPVTGLPVAGSWVSYYVDGGKVYAAGLNSMGQLGNGSADVFVPHPTFTPVQRAGGADLTGISAVSAGSAFGIALGTEGQVWTWGDNQYGQLGDGTLTERHQAVAVGGLPACSAISASTGRDRGTGPVHDHVLALAQNGTVWAWGENRDGELGNGSPGIVVTDPVTVSDPVTNPVQVLTAPAVPLTNVKAIATGGTHSLALRQDGTVWSWGYNGSGQLGNGSYGEGAHGFATQVPGLHDIKTITAGPSTSFAVDSDLHVWAWGFNYYYHALCVGPQPADAGGGSDPKNFVPSPTLVKTADGSVFTL